MVTGEVGVIFKKGRFFILSLLIPSILCAGENGTFSRSGWAGSSYVSAGMTGVVSADDTFSIFWNPAGLSELILKSTGDTASGGNESDDNALLNFSENSGKSNFLSLGVSYTKPDIKKDVSFTGCAFGLFEGVFGIALYGEYERGEDESENRRDISGYFSYSGSMDIFSAGISLKPVYIESDGKSEKGIGGELGFQVYLLPVFKAGMAVRDIEIYTSENSSRDYEVFDPEASLGISLSTFSDLEFSLSVSCRPQDKDVYGGGGVSYRLRPYLVMSAGLFYESVTAGFEIDNGPLSIGWAVLYDYDESEFSNTIGAEFIF